ncbi:DsbA family protein [Paracoccus sp. TOH]|uniref:DsbA family protein n=1 Tax=Paracoccus sp. TOH TaxID=1263728 RepID=UPI0025AFBEBC|nr:DsbA family protein [Paracoccus sp. TOH]WJS87444.1 DsbA family protein [Paracoccus sp. TOH]
MSITRRDILAGAAGFGLAGTAGGAILLGRDRAGGSGGDKSAAAAEMSTDEVLRDPDNPVLGNPEGALTIVEYFDYQCPYCKMGHAMLTDVVAKDGDIRLVMKDWPIFGAPSVLASQLVLGAASMGDYAQAHAALMATEARLTEDQIRQVLGDGGIDTVAALAAYRAERGKWDGLLARNSAQAAALGLRGTPAFIIGKTIYPGALDETRLRGAIAEARRTS